jgi:alpha-beta hydrolase superfamily lysophospholipase
VTYPGGARGESSLTANPGFHEPTSKHATLVDAARWACYRTLWPRQAGLPHTAEAAMCKCSSARKRGAAEPSGAALPQGKEAHASQHVPVHRRRRAADNRLPLGPPGRPRAVLQVTHGMGEHALRYGKFAEAMNERGLVVYAQDHRGHGATAGDGVLGDLGEGGWPRLVEDIGLLSAGIRAQHPGLPLILLGHSMGSFAVQQYLLDHSADADAVILTGTAVIDLLEPALDLDQPLDLAMFNAAFQPARTGYDWLTRDEAIVDAYVADPRCGFGLDTGAAKAMFAGARRLADPAEVAAMRPDLPVYITAGESDPVNGQLALLTPLAERYRAAERSVGAPKQLA